ncbi:hypothetical protein [Glycomyces terrestris]|uniref:Uncharacterized protein n=1 Tax=Glycomyces terrestris TaxID=2493553 RepID=A0A426UWU5_9ACTN|nr:hypothetical protein [Glycomyces terrestris]RRR99103.1 hypothetical protein EIW28_10130 [Glycomyces terrestris]
MSTPDENLFEEAFAEFAHTAELMVDPVDSAVIHGRVRRRRATKGALAAALAALIVAVPAAWWLQESNGDEVDPSPAEETTDETTSRETTPAEDGGAGSNSVPEGQETGLDQPVLPTFGDLVGAEIELPEFFPGEGSLNDICPTGPATISDAAGAGYGDGSVRLLKLVQTTLEEGGPVEAVALFGCAPGDGMLTQAVSVAGDGDGGWEVTEEIALGTLDSFPLIDIAPAAVTGVLLLVPEPHGTDHQGPLDYEIFRYRTGAELEDVTDSAYKWGIADLAVEVEKTDNGDGTWTAAVTITNTGDHESQGFALTACADAALTVEEVDGLPGCTEDYRVVEEYAALEAGESVTEEWTVDPAPFDEWSGDAQAGGAYLEVRVRTPMYGVDGFAFDYDGSNDYGNMSLIVDDVT